MTISREYARMTYTASFAAWACKVLDNRILAHLQKKRRENRKIDPYAEVDPEAREIGTGRDINPELKRRLAECLRQLCRRNPRYARALNLHYQGYSTDEICDRTRTRPATLYSTLHKARAMLRECLETGGQQS